MVLSTPFSRKSIWPRSHSLVTLLLIYSVTRRRCLILHDDALGTTVHGVPYLIWNHCHPCNIEVFDPLVIFFLSTIAANRLHSGDANAVGPVSKLMRYPHARLPGTGILTGLDDANLTCIITITKTNDLATTSMPPLRVFFTSYVWCVVVTNAIFMVRRSWCKKVRRRRLRRRRALARFTSMSVSFPSGISA